MNLLYMAILADNSIIPVISIFSSIDFAAYVNANMIR